MEFTKFDVLPNSLNHGFSFSNGYNRLLFTQIETTSEDQISLSSLIAKIREWTFEEFRPSQFNVGRMLGQGSSSEVYLVTDNNDFLQMPYALKCINKNA